MKILIMILKWMDFLNSLNEFTLNLKSKTTYIVKEYNDYIESLDKPGRLTK